MLQETIPEWVVNAKFNEMPAWIETQNEWADYVDARFMEGLMEETRSEVCPICRSYMNADVICNFCGFGEDEELYDALKSAANMHEAYAEF